MRAYYNEFDPYAAAWLRNLIAAGHIAAGDVDERSIVDVQPADLAGYDQCHFFAGIGGWSLALRLAGWPDDKPVWTGSCPCQPFSAAGKRKGTDDARHLWPEFARLIGECRPPVVFGEQVASADGRDWLAGVRADLEDLAYAVGAADLCAAGAGAPHIRQRLWWVADAGSERRDGLDALLRGEARGRDAGNLPEAAGHGATGRLADAMRGGTGHGSADGHIAEGTPFGLDGDPSRAGVESWGGGASLRLANADGGLSGDGGLQPGGQHGLGDAGADGRRDSGREHPEGDGRLERRPEPSGRGVAGGRGEGFWSAFDLLPCTDGKARRVEPGTFPLAHGVPNRVGRLRAYGNAIVPEVAATFIGAWLETRT